MERGYCSSDAVPVLQTGGCDGDASGFACNRILECHAAPDGQCCDLCRSINLGSSSLAWSISTRSSAEIIRGLHLSAGNISGTCEPRSLERSSLQGSTNNKSANVISESLEKAGPSTSDHSHPTDTISSCARVESSPNCLAYRKIFVKRDERAVGRVRFITDFPADDFFSQRKIISKEIWTHFIEGLNRHCAKLNSSSKFDCFRKLAPCNCWRPKEENVQELRIRRYVVKHNKKFFIPRGFFVVDPLYVGFNMLEIVLIGDMDSLCSNSVGVSTLTRRIGEERDAELNYEDSNLNNEGNGNGVSRGCSDDRCNSESDVAEGELEEDEATLQG